jgi:predicted secreted protein
MSVIDLTQPGDPPTVIREQISAGDRLKVLLREIPSAGYSWSVRGMSGPVSLEDFELLPGPESDSEAVGGAAVRELCVRAGAAGSSAAGASVDLVYARPWESSVLYRVRVELEIE